MMKMKLLKHLLPLCLSALVLGGALVWASGCDFSRVDDGVDAPVETLIEEVDAATTTGDAEQAIHRLFNKAGVGGVSRPGVETGPFALFKLNEEQERALAEAQAQFNSGDTEKGMTVEELYETMLEPNGLAGGEADLDDLVWVLNRAAEEAGAEGNEVPATITSTGEVVMGKTTSSFGRDRVLSPVQQFLFGIWASYHAPYVPDLDGSKKSKSGGGGHGNPNPVCPSGTLLGKFEVYGDHYREETNLRTVDVLPGPDGAGAGGTFSSDEDVYMILLKGGTDVDSYPLYGHRSGSFDGRHLENRGGQSDDEIISNVQFCGGGGLEFSCPTLCWFSKVVCLFTRCKSASACYSDFHECLQECHNQGSGD